MKWIRLILIGLPLCFCSCRTMGDISSTLAIPCPSKPLYYAGVDNMKLHSAPNHESSTVQKVPLNEEIVLLKTKISWAFVEIPRTDSTGWVEKTYLEKTPVKIKKVKKAKTVTNESEHAEEAADAASHGKAKESILDVLQPDSAIAAPPHEGEPAKPKTKADVFDAF